MIFFIRQNAARLLLVFLFGLLFTTTAWHYSEGAVSPEKLREDETKVLAELVALKLQIESAQSEKQALEEQLRQNLREKSVREQELDKTRADLVASTRELGRWAEFTYRHGYISFLDVLFAASDFNDLINRSSLLWAIMDKQARVIEQNRALTNLVEEQLIKITAINESITDKRFRLEETMAGLRGKETELEQMLDDLRKQSAELEARLSRLSQQWTEVTGLTAYIIHRLSTLPEDELSPDSLRFTLGGIRVEYTSATINRAIKKVSPDPDGKVTVLLQPEKIIISGSTGSPVVKFSLVGNFEITPDQKKIVFVPDSITVNQDTMEGQMIRVIADNSDLTWDITRYYPRLTVTGVTNGSGKITFNLR